MDRERLREVVRVLEELPPEKHFDLHLWNKCGTVGCAVGWAASDPWFIEKEFHLLKLGCNRDGKMRYQPAFYGDRNWAAVTRFFSICGDDAHFLFSADEYDEGTKDDVIRRIKDFIA